jgi:hypothetical protein
VPEPLRPLAATSPLRVLGMVARPGGLGSLDVDHEKRRLQQALAGLESTGRVQLSWVTGQTWKDLQDALDEGGWHIFHFIGHGGYDRERGEGILALADEDGELYRLASSDMGLILGDHRSLRLVVLNSCESARANANDVFSSTAAVLMRRGIPAVVAMQYEISDLAAIAFARGLYGALASRHPVDHAVTRARRAIKLSCGNSLEWATPVLYLRSSSAQLFDLAAAPVLAEVIRAEPEPQASDLSANILPRKVSQAPTADSSPKPLGGVPHPPRALRQPVGSPLARMKHGANIGSGVQP